MPRIRNIKPQFWLDENLGTIPRDARLLYIGLWNLADDTGVFEWRPVRIKVQLFPYDSDIKNGDIEKWLKALQEIGDIIPFDSDGEQFGFIRGFVKHQDIKKPSQWTFAEVPEVVMNSTPPVPHQYPTSGVAVPLGDRGYGIGDRSVGSRSIGNREPFPKKDNYGTGKNVLLTSEEYGKLKDRFNGDTENRIDRLSLYLGSSGKKYKSHYMTILSWAERDKENGNDGQRTNAQRDSIPGNRPSGAFAEIEARAKSLP